jgi:hypothetical protein
MKLFSRLFHRTAPIPPTLDERIAILDSRSADLILDTAIGTDDEGLRVAAIHKLSDGEALRRLAGVSGPADGASRAFPAAVARAAQARMAQLIDAGSIDFAEFCGRVPNRSTMFSVAALCQDSSRLPQALASIADPIQVAQLVVQGPSSRLRQLAAALVEEPAQIRQLMKQVRSKDKSVYKILKQKCDALSAKERQAAALANEVGAIRAALERHSHRPYDAFYAPALEQLIARWDSLGAQPDVAGDEHAKAAMDRCRDVVAAHQRQVAQQAAEQAAQHAAELAAQDTRQRVLQAAQEAAAAEADAAAQLLKEAAAVREAELTARAQQSAAEEQVFRQIGGLIRKAHGTLDDGNTQRAAGLRRAIAEKLPATAAVPTHLMRHLQQLDDKLNELKQWKDYAVAPKRIELIEEMETLVGSTEEPRVLADRIKSLQEEWRTIGKGIVSDAPEDWERFHQASQAAYRPCREYFEAQAKLRQENLQNRKAVLERLTAYEAAQNAENPDWRLLASVLREAPREWRQYSPVDRDAGRPAQADFDGSMGRLQAKLDAWHERNVADKQALINRARQLLTQEDSREAIEAVKRLQILWKETAPAPREQEQSLWCEFREVCDAVYQRRQQAYAEYTAGLEANKSKAQELCEEAERAAASAGATLLEGATKIPEWRSAFDALGEMPRADARGLQDRFERALDRCRAQLARQHLRDAEQAFTDLIEAGRRIQAYEWAVAQNAVASDREALKQVAETFITGVQHWPEGGLRAAKEALAKADSASDSGVEAREKALRTLCIRCEILSETATPPEDEALRREYQVQRLVQGMGQGSHVDDEDWDAMALHWIRIGAVSPTAYESLQGRFMRCRAKRPLRNSQQPAFPTGDGADDRNGPDNRTGHVRSHGRDRSKIATAR